jgi:hypothetical protein
VTFSRSSGGALAEQACTAETAVDNCSVTRGLTGAARVAVSPDGDNVYAASYDGSTLVTFARSSGGTLTAQGSCLGASGNADGCTVQPGLSAPAGLAVSPDGGNVYTAALTGDALDTFLRVRPAPTATTGQATGITLTGATLSATVNPNNAATTAYFQYGTSASYGEQTVTQSVGSGGTNHTVTATLAGLTPGTQYHFRVVASSASGTTDGADQTFTSASQAPAVSTGAATGVATTAATLNGTVNPESQSATYRFDYGTTTGDGQSTAATSAGSGSSAVNVSAALSGLAPGQTYHYRLEATNLTGTTYGPDQTFTTTGGSSYVQTVLASHPVAYWRLGESHGPTAADQTGAHPGTYVGAVTYGVPGAIAGDPNTAVTVNGSTGRVRIPYRAALNPSTAWSAEAWVKVAAYGKTDDESVMASRLPSSSGHAGYDLGLAESTGKPFVVYATGSAYGAIEATTPVALNSWTYLVATYSGGQLSLYVNGKLAVGPLAVTFSPNRSEATEIGAIAGGSGQFLAGRVDEVALYRSALPAATIAGHYAAATRSRSAAITNPGRHARMASDPQAALVAKRANARSERRPSRRHTKAKKHKRSRRR